MMEKQALQHRETLLLEALICGLDARENAKEAHAQMLHYLSELFVKRAREELDEVRIAIEQLSADAAKDGAG